MRGATEEKRGNDVRPTERPTHQSAFCRVETKKRRVIIPRNNMRELFIVRAPTIMSPLNLSGRFPSFYIARAP